MRPSGTPTETAKIIARMVSSMVVGRRSMRSSVTGSECLIDVPRSPRSELLEVGDELDGDRLVEPVAVDEVVADLVGGALTEDCPAGVAGDQSRQREHDEDDPEQDRDRDEDPAEDELGHGWGSSPPVRAADRRSGAPRMRRPRSIRSRKRTSSYAAGGLRKPPHRPGQ